MYVKSIIKLLAEMPGLSIYAIARIFRAGDSSVYYPLKRLKDTGVVTESNELTDLGWHLLKLIKATEHDWVSRERCIHLCGWEAIKTGEELRIIEQRKNAIIVKEIKDPSPQECSCAKRESMYGELAVEAFNTVKGLLETLNLPPETLDLLPAPPPDPPLPRFLFKKTRN